MRGRAADDCWDNATDKPYFEAIVTAIEGDFCADTGRRFLSGYSSGSFFAHRMACLEGDRFLGVATIAGGQQRSGCTGQIASLQIHDQNDTTVTIQSSGYPTRDSYISANHCDATTEPTLTTPCVAYDGCDSDYPVVWCETTGQNHSRQDALAAGVFWDFLSEL